ncbi:MAG: RNA-binding S4 domain-containing protein [Paracoccaceae bacterium]|nr:RNA-binding S4 domain-containing protein [Paracoccaceae bacterium]
MRVDKWLWQARFFKTRTRASEMVAAGHLRVNAVRAAKAAHPVAPGDTLVFPQGRHIRTVRIVAIPTRRGPAAEAATLYDDLTPPAAPVAPRSGPRPTKKARRDAGFSKDGPLD